MFFTPQNKQRIIQSPSARSGGLSSDRWQFRQMSNIREVD
jgi:hypothetical protein